VGHCPKLPCCNTATGESTLNLPVKAVRRVISTEYETDYTTAFIYVYLHRSENSYVDYAAKAINDKEFEANDGGRYTVKATKMEEKGLPWTYTDLQYEQGVSVKLIMEGGRILDIQDQFFFGLSDARQQSQYTQQQQSPPVQRQQSQPTHKQQLSADQQQQSPSAQQQQAAATLNRSDEAETTEEFEVDCEGGKNDSDSGDSQVTVVQQQPQQQPQQQSQQQLQQQTATATSQKHPGHNGLAETTTSHLQQQQQQSNFFSFILKSGR
jgi:hypothetical protein